MRYTLDADELAAVEAIVEHTFSNKELLRTALTHSSAGPSNGDALATLGDLVHSVWIVRTAYGATTSPTMSGLTGVVNHCRWYVEQARLLYGLGLHEYVVLGPATLGHGGRVTEKMAATVFEALVAAIELDGGRDDAKAFLDRVAGPTVNGMLARTERQHAG